MTTDRAGYTWDAGSLRDAGRPRGMEGTPEQATAALLAALADLPAGTTGRVKVVGFASLDRAHVDGGLVCLAEVQADGGVRILP